jgi:glycosyltransferase involved in cell wall biosynthesis
MQNKRFSIITPLYKKGYLTLDKFFLSLKEQDYKNFEIILVHNSPDNEGKDAVKKILRGKTVKKLDIREIDAGYNPKLKRGNHCRAFNEGAKVSTGDYLLFLDPEVYLYPGILREYKDAFENHNADFVYGDYDFENGAGRVEGRKYSEYELKCANYISGAFPIKKEAFKGWDENLQSLQDWDMRLNAVECGAKGFYIGRPCFTTEVPKEDGISGYSSQNWLECYNKVRSKHLPVSNTVITSLGAPHHATKTAELLNCDVRVYNNILTFKPHEYKNIYLLGFYPLAWEEHLRLFYDLGDINKPVAGEKRIIHWIGTDIWQLMTKVNWMAFKNITGFLNHKDHGFIHLCEDEQTQKELKDLGIRATVIPLPVKKIEPVALPEEFTVGVYINPTQNMYSEEFMYSIAEAMPDIKFKFFGSPNMVDKTEENKEWVGWVDMKEFLPKISALVRLTQHDGLPVSPIEAMMMGRNVLASHEMRYALKADDSKGDFDKNEIIKQIREMQSMPFNSKGSEYWIKETDPELFKKRMNGIIQS